MLKKTIYLPAAQVFLQSCTWKYVILSPSFGKPRSEAAYL